MSTSEEQKDPKSPMTSLNKASSSNRSIFEIGPLAWIRKEINIYTIQNIFVSTIVSLLICGSKKLDKLKNIFSTLFFWQEHELKFC